MFGLRQIFKTSLRGFSAKSLQNEGFLRKIATQTNESPINQENHQESLSKHPVGKLNVTTMKILFTCQRCNTRNSKTMSKLAYTKGVVIIRCDGCKNNHLIADNLGWFGVNPKKRNIEKILKDKGETVKRMTMFGADTIEYLLKDEKSQIKNENIKEIQPETPQNEQ